MTKFSVLHRIESESVKFVDVPIHRLSSTPSPWAVLLVKFSDDPTQDPDRGIYERLFTTAGNGTQNMVKWFADMSHGRLDVSDSRVFGWYTLPYRRADYVGNATPTAGKIDRAGLLDAARAAATAAGLQLSDFSGVVVSAYGATDLCGWVGGMAALCDQFSLQPSLLGQEMGHGYGLDHARRHGSDEDYRDPYDIMSTAAYPAMEQPDSDYTDIGPGLNAQNMRARGWLDENRVWSSDGAYNVTLTLRPLHWLELPGTLVADVGGLLVEFRVPQRWDAGIDEAVVLVHRFADNHSYLMPADNGQDGLTAGSVLTVGRPDFVFASHTRIEVVAIDASGHTATVHIHHRPAVRRRDDAVVGTVFGGVSVDGGGFIVLPDGRVVPVPPRGPITELVAHVAKLADHELAGDIALGIAVRRSLIRSIMATGDSLLEENDLISSGPPRLKAGKRETHR
jgi:hypothetical protein